MASDLHIYVKASDGASATFAKVGDGAAKLGETLSQVGSKGTSGMNDILVKAKSMSAELNTVGTAMVGIGATMTAAVAVPIAAGTKAAWSQVDAVQKATTALRAYEQDASKVNTTLKELVAYARSSEGTLFQRTDLFAAAQGLKVAGAETKNLTEYVKIMSRAVAVGMTDWGELTQVLQRVGSTGRLAGYDFDMLTKAGFQLNTELRNQTVTWEQLFSALDQGIPGIGDTLNTIEGQTTKLNSAIRELGLAFLQVDRDTSQFIEGGLGDQLYQGLGTARELVLAMVPAAEVFGKGAAFAATAASALTTVVLAMPQPLQTAVIGLTGVSGVALTAGGSLLLLLPRIAATKAALETLGGMSKVLSMLGFAFNPVTLGAAALVAVGGLLLKSYLDQRKAAQEYSASLTTLGETIEILRRKGDTALAGLADNVDKELSSAHDKLMQFVNDIKSQPQLGQTGWLPTGLESDLDKFSDSLLQKYQTWDGVADHLTATAGKISGVMDIITEALNEPHIDATKYLKWALGLLEAADGAEALADAIETIETTPLSDFSTAASEAAESADVLMASATELKAVFADLPVQLDDLRIDAKGALASDLERLGTAMTNAFAPTYQGMSTDFMIDDFHRLADAAIESSTVSEDALESLGGAWKRISDKMKSGNLDNAAIIRDMEAILSDPGTLGDEKVAAIEALSNSLSQYIDKHKDLKAAQIEWLADGAHILDWWQEYDRTVNQSVAGIMTTTAELDAFGERAAFRLQLGWADDIRDAATALDGALAVFGRIDELAGRSERAGSIAEKLVGEPGVWHEIDDMLQAGTISQEKYNVAVEAGHGIQWSNARTQALLNDVRRDQLPLLHEETLAYEQNIARLKDLEPVEQRRVLMLQDTAVQTQIASLYSTAYAASIGEIPEEAATWMILEAAEADAGLKDLLMDLGLITEDEHGIRVNFPDGDTVQTTLDNLTKTLSALNQTIQIAIGIDIGTDHVDALEQIIEDPAAAMASKVGTITVRVLADTSAAETKIDNINQSHADMDGKSSTLKLGITDDAAQVITDTSAAHQAVDGTISTLMLNADKSSAEEGITWAEGYQDVVLATSYIDIVTRTSTLDLGRRSARHGGIPGYAMGGIVAELAEAGPEWLHFAGGGVALAPERGLYDIPPNTYVSPANAGGPLGGLALTINVTGPVYGIDDLAAQVTEELVPAIVDAVDGVRRSYGGNR